MGVQRPESQILAMFLSRKPLVLARSCASGSGRRRAAPGPGNHLGSARRHWRAAGIAPSGRRPTHLRRLHRLAVEGRCRRFYTTARPRPRPRQCPVVALGSEPWKTTDDRAATDATGTPTTAWTAEHPSRVRRPRSAHPVLCRDRRYHQRPFRVRQIVLPIVTRRAMVSFIVGVETPHRGPETEARA